MTPNKGGPQTEPEKISLRDRIRQHQRRKSWLTRPLLTLGMIGLILPLLPAVIFFELGLRLDSPFGKSSLYKYLRGKNKT
ncbi:hypothetical protein ACFLT7_04660 [candidate division KSB1 bacterium]